jgi:hypothetical protein
LSRRSTVSDKKTLKLLGKTEFWTIGILPSVNYSTRQCWNSIKSDLRSSIWVYKFISLCSRTTEMKAKFILCPILRTCSIHSWKNSFPGNLHGN